MKEKIITDLGNGMYRVFSEPGDATRYDYFVYRDGDVDFCFMPKGSKFQFPQRLNYYEITDDEEKLYALSSRESCNVWTLKECIRTIKELYVT